MFQICLFCVAAEECGAEISTFFQKRLSIFCVAGRAAFLIDSMLQVSTNN